MLGRERRVSLFNSSLCPPPPSQRAIKRVTFLLRRDHSVEILGTNSKTIFASKITSTLLRLVVKNEKLENILTFF